MWDARLVKGEKKHTHTHKTEQNKNKKSGIVVGCCEKKSLVTNSNLESSLHNVDLSMYKTSITLFSFHYLLTNLMAIDFHQMSK